MMIPSFTVCALQCRGSAQLVRSKAYVVWPLSPALSWRREKIESLDRREGQRAGRLQRQFVSDFAVVLAGEFEAHDLERALDRAKVGDHSLVALHRAVEEGLAHQRVGRGVPEQPAPGDGSALDASAFQQFAPAPGGFGVRDVDRLGVV